MLANDPAFEPDTDHVEVGEDLDHPADRDRVYGVVVAESPHVVVAREPDPEPQLDWWCQRRQRQHRGLVDVEQVGWAGLQRPHRACVGPRQPAAHLGVKSAGEVKSRPGRKEVSK